MFLLIYCIHWRASKLPDIITNSGKCQVKYYTEEYKMTKTYLDKLMEIYIIDIWLEKLRRGWSLDDVPNEAIKEAIIDILRT